MPEAPPAEPSFAEAVGSADFPADAFVSQNQPTSKPPPAAPPAPPKPPDPTKPPPAAAAPPPAEPKRPAIPPLKAAAPPAPVDEEVPESIKSTKAADDWRKLHSETKTLRAKTAEL